jgi:hypothetical protein
LPAFLDGAKEAEQGPGILGICIIHGILSFGWLSFEL